jgi:hypothetical protein
MENIAHVKQGIHGMTIITELVVQVIIPFSSVAVQNLQILRGMENIIRMAV